MTAHVEQAIERYFRGEIRRVEERDALFGHLDRCPECRQAFESCSAAHRLLARREHPRVELEAMLPALLDGVDPVPSTRTYRWLRWIAPLAASVGAAVLFVRGPDAPTPKGGTHAQDATIEALCFDASMNITAHRRESGACPAPGYLKLLYASPQTVPALTVVVLAGEEVRLDLHLAKPEPRSVLADYAKLGPGETLRVIAVPAEADTPLELAKRTPEVLSIRGEAP